MFVTSDGSDYTRFKQRALATGNLTLIRTAAAELPHVGIQDALQICLLLRDGDPDLYERARGPMDRSLCAGEPPRRPHRDPSGRRGA